MNQLQVNAALERAGESCGDNFEIEPVDFIECVAAFLDELVAELGDDEAVETIRTLSTLVENS